MPLLTQSTSHVLSHILFGSTSTPFLQPAQTSLPPKSHAGSCMNFIYTSVTIWHPQPFALLKQIALDLSPTRNQALVGNDQFSQIFVHAFQYLTQRRP